MKNPHYLNIDLYKLIPIFLVFKLIFFTLIFFQPVYLAFSLSFSTLLKNVCHLKCF